jgi:hypothetical protein
MSVTGVPGTGFLNNDAIMRYIVAFNNKNMYKKLCIPGRGKTRR